ncbi:Transcription factor bHLH117 [Raphanus sativus]|nr:Transcription factor bHLH117 [Raphanus sativus]
MESGYEFDALSELPPLPQVYAPPPMEYYHPYDDDIESLPPFPQSDFTPHGGGFITFSDTHQDSSLSLLTRDYLTESNLFSHDVVAATPFLHLPDLKSVEEPPSLSLAPPSVARHNSQRHVNNNAKSVASQPPVHGARKVSDRIRSLEKIMPWEKKMSLAAILEETHKQQLLQVIANSPGSRNVLYTQGVCVFSYEQLLSLQMMAESTRNF